MEERIELGEPELVAMRAEEHREAVSLLAALIRAARPALPAHGAAGRRGQAIPAAALPLAGGANGNAASSDTPDRHHLTGLGARVAAFCLDRSRSELPAVARDGDLWRALAHRMGVNDFFCRLVLACDQSPGCGVHAWEDERQIRGGKKQVQADAFGRLLHPGGAVEFLLEYDRGTEHFWAVVKKLERYLTVSSAHSPEEPAPFPNVLFLVGGEAREAMLSRALGVAVERWDLRRARSAAMPFYVSNRRILHEEGHLGAVWQPLTEPDGRLRLTEMDGTPECWWDLSECLRVRWLEGAREP